MFKEHAEMRDKYLELNKKIDRIAAFLNTVPNEDKLAAQYTDIDQEIYELYVWYDENKKLFEKYTREKREQDEKIIKINEKINMLNSKIKSIK